MVIVHVSITTMGVATRSNLYHRLFHHNINSRFTISYIKHTHSTRMQPAYPTVYPADVDPSQQPKIPPQPMIFPPDSTPSTMQPPGNVPDDYPGGKNNPGYRTSEVIFVNNPQHQKSELICETCHANQLVFVGTLLWIAAICLMLARNDSVDILASVISTVGTVLVFLPCCCCHPFCKHYDHGCCYTEYH